MQVIFCSRTHSQLSQTIAELHRTLFADSTTGVTLASRKVPPARTVSGLQHPRWHCRAPGKVCV